MEAPEGIDLIQVRVCATMAGVSYGDVIFVDPSDPEMQCLLNATPPLLVPVGEVGP